MDDFLVIAHCKRNETVPHWLHQATMNTLEIPCKHIDAWESHIFDIGKSRQRIAEVFLSMPEATHLLFVDDDIVVPDPQSLVRLYTWLKEHDQYIISGLFYNKTERLTCPTCKQGIHDPLIFYVKEDQGDGVHFAFPFTNQPIPENKVLKVTCLATGFLLIRREIFEKLEPPYFVYAAPELRRPKQDTDGPGEDVYFSLKAQKAGFNLFVHTGVELLHYVPRFVGNQKMIAEITGKDRSLWQQAKQVDASTIP